MVYYSYDTEFGPMLIVSDGAGIKGICSGADADTPRARRALGGQSGAQAADALTDLAAKQLEEYFAGKRRHFDLPLDPSGTDFQKSVWRCLLTIPYGETRSYKQVAEMIGNPLAVRAVGMANNRNPIMIIIPCHRVIGSNGSLVGYGGGLEMKRRLLELEST